MYALGAALLLAFVSIPVAAIGVMFAAHRQAVLAADLSALGGAKESLNDETLACFAAASIAAANGARLQRCALSGGALQVEVTVSTQLALLPDVGATSKAGVRPELS